jgi:xanthine dehydrogenase YagR molybdenum-binding subunit
MPNVHTMPLKVNGALPRVDGPLKVTGTARYTSDQNLPGMLYAVPVCASIAKGRIESMDTSRAESIPGVKAGSKSDRGRGRHGDRHGAV